MDWLDVLQRIQTGEDAQTELGRFRSFNDKDWQEAVCAFANTEGGLVVLGVTDDRSIDGVPMDPEVVQERLSNALHNTFNAPIQARLGCHQDPNGWVHWIEVARVRGPEPLRHKGRVLVRGNRGNREPSVTELQELYNTFGLVFTEERVIPGTDADAIDAAAFRAYMRRRGVDLDGERLPLEVDLFNWEILDRDFNGDLRATLFGLLCFGKTPQQYAPTRNLWVDLVAYAGTDRGDHVLLAGEGRGRLDEQVAHAEAWLKALGRHERYAGMQRADQWPVPLPAFRECVVNAVAHRDYAILGSRVLVEVFDDRLVVTSPGALPNHKRPESVLAGGTPRSRNEAIANFLFDLGLMEQRGSGYPRMTRAMRQFNGTIPHLEQGRDERWVRVTLWRTPPAATTRPGIAGRKAPMGNWLTLPCSAPTRPSSSCRQDQKKGLASQPDFGYGPVSKITRDEDHCMKKTLIALAAGVLFTGSALAADLATPDEAKAMSQKAQAAVNQMGKDQAFASFAAADGGFKVKDLYVFCMDMDGVMLSHAIKPELVGKNLLDFNKYGDELFKNMIATAKASGEGWVDYKWPYPGTEEIREKTSYVMTNNAGFFCGVGAYK